MKIFLQFFLMFITLIALLSVYACEQKIPQNQQQEQQTVYTDPKGFFKITPPLDWNIQEYPSDPRGKVAFISSAAQTDLRVLAKAVDIPDFDGLIKDLKDKEIQLGVEMNIEPTVFKKMPAVKRVATITMQGVTVKLLWIDLLINGVSHNLQFTSTPNNFDNYYEAAWNSMLTYEPIEREKPATQEEALHHEVAKWIRLANIAIEWNNIQTAKEAVAIGLELEPKNAELLRLNRELNAK